MDRIRANLRVNGVVQGVGFRPFLHRQMQAHGLAGWICNSSGGVELEAEGFASDIDAFIHALRHEAPALARIDMLSIETSTELAGHSGIAILESRALARRNTLISPDTATCPDCLRELFQPSDRRYRYPFINCTNCGPRFSIIKDLPYDRRSTTMSTFPMCPDCAAEYTDIANRRYHAQPDCCEKCGPELFFLDGAGGRIGGDPLANAARQLRNGKVIAIKGLGGIHLACRFDDPAIVQELRRRKRREEKPFAVMCRDVETARRFCELSPEEEALLSGHIRPILLLKKKEYGSHMYLSENKYLGVMLPYTPVHHLIFAEGFDALVMTSANLSDLPILIENREAVERLRGIADGFLLNNREIENRCDDSLLYLKGGAPFFIRRSRGYAPLPLQIEGLQGGILACGAEQKASFCLSRPEQAFPSAHIGDLKNAETLAHYTRQLALYERMFDVKPVILACDLHPDYLSADYARKRAGLEKIPLLEVQHHHAHMAACMADNGLDGECIGIVWDGTGYGADGGIWGGEFLVGGYAGFRRAGSMRPLKLPGGDRAIKEIWRIGVALALDAGQDPHEFFPSENAEKIIALLEANLNCPPSSGMGRLFDGVSAILGICRNAGYEGQGAVLLESRADEDCADLYPFRIEYRGMYALDYREMLACICRDHAAGISCGTTAAKFMNTLCQAALEICKRIRCESSLNRVALSGGVFQNMYLLNRLTAALESGGFEVFRHCRVSTNDEGVSLGQLAIANYKLMHP